MTSNALVRRNSAVVSAGEAKAEPVRAASARPDKNRRLHDKIFTEKLKSTLKEYTQKKARMLAKKKYIRSYDHNSATGKSKIDVESLGQFDSLDLRK